ncbi:MAG TPA: cyclic nucleotide-binding domain-containing protein [Gaiellaceae bacterium]|nr:cyclic nucleotide-binding domain-containing protein [Gaiellaceae bacterium]
MPLSKNEKVELLRRIPLFAACTRRELIEVALVADEREAGADEVLMEQGQPGREFFVLIDGTVVVRRHGRKLANLGPGDWFGEIALLTFKPRSATVTAISPCRLLVIQDRSFRQVVEATPRIALRVLGSVSQRLERDGN